MSYLIDTCVLSELRKRRPHPGVIAWIESRPATSLYISVLTLGEIRKGIERLADGERKFRLLDWLETELPTFFVGRIVSIDTEVADRWGHLMAEAGRSLPTIDSLLAATALVHDLVLVTRNVKDFSYAALGSVVTRFSAKWRYSGYERRPRMKRYSWHSGWQCPASA